MTWAEFRFMIWLLLAVTIIVGAITSARGRDNGQLAQVDPLIRQWFNGLSSKKGDLCCSMADGQSVDDPEWDRNGNHYRVRLNGEWFDVPENSVVNGNNRIGRAIVWPTRYDGKTFIRCFMPGAEG